MKHHAPINLDVQFYQQGELPVGAVSTFIEARLQGTALAARSTAAPA